MLAACQLMDRVIPQELVELAFIVHHVFPAREQCTTSPENPGTLGEKEWQVGSMVEYLTNVNEVDRLVPKRDAFSDANEHVHR